MGRIIFGDIPKVIRIDNRTCEPSPNDMRVCSFESLRLLMRLSHRLQHAVEVEYTRRWQDGAS